MRKLFSIFCFVLLYTVITMGQPAIEMQFTTSSPAASGSTVLSLGLDTDALPNNGHPPFPPPGTFDAAWVISGDYYYTDNRQVVAFPYTGTQEHLLTWQQGSGATTFNITYDLPTGVTMRVIDNFGFPTPIFDSGILSGTGNLNVPLTYTTVKVIMNYVNVGPPAPGPVFAVSPLSLNFGNIPVGESSTLQLTVSNLGFLNPMELTSASILNLNPDYLVVPNPPTTFPIEIGPEESYVFDVTFTPGAEGTIADSVVFEHNAPGTPSKVPVTGNGTVQYGELVFSPQTRTIFDNATGYSSTVRLQNYVGVDLKALQFKIVLDGLLNFRSISRGAAVPAADWNFSYTVSPGAFNLDGSRNDTIKVVILGNGTNQIPPGADYEIAVFEYDVIDISTEQENTTVHFEGVVGGTGTPEPGKNANIVPLGPQEITVLNRVTWGDVNFDNRVDLLDILLMIDYILDKVEFTQAQFDRGDIAPWASGDPAPTGDGVINALDLALLQNIVLTGIYPSGEPAAIVIPLFVTENSLKKLNPGDDAALTFYINEEGIFVVLETIVNVKGLQVEFSKLTSSTSGMVVSTALGNGYYYQSNDYLRSLVYADNGATVGKGEYSFLNMPFYIPAPRDLKLEHVILADENNQKIEKVTLMIIYGSAPFLPTEYNLSQNYPNPFNPTTKVDFTVPRTNKVTLKVYDMLGQEIRTLYSGWVDRGSYTVQWDGLNDAGIEMSAGSYIYRMIADEFVQAKKMILLK
jgi:hypothetical protein